VIAVHEWCDRCGAETRDVTGWIVDVIDGLIIEVACPECQTPEQTAEADANSGRAYRYVSHDDGTIRYLIIPDEAA
jgi:hypothetical protein